MQLETLKSLLEVNERNNLYSMILNKLGKLGDLDYISYKTFKTSEGIIPIIFITNCLDDNNIKYVKMFVGAQHNEYNGLFGILEYLEMIQDQKVSMSDILIDDQVLIFAPLMNPYGFLHPSKDNKSGYYLKNKTNLNRFWRRIFVPEYEIYCEDEIEFPIPEHAKIVKEILKKYWEREDISIYLLDIHETSLLKRFQAELSENLKEESITYKFDHWLKEAIIQNVMTFHNIKYFREPLFYKCKPSADHNHISLSIKLLDIVHEKLFQYIIENQDKLPFYFCFSDKSKEKCEVLANFVYNKLKDKLWETKFPSINHHFHDHGCFVKMGDATSRSRVYSMELESQKQFFNLFEEIEQSKSNPNYFKNKLESINLSIELVMETIFALIKLF